MVLDLLAAVREQSDRFADVLATADPGAPVPTCPEWTATDLAWHLTEVQLFWAVIVRDRLTDPAPSQAAKPPRPADHARTVTLLRDATTMLVDALDGAADTEPVWTWFAGERTVGFVRRRQAHEALIHRLDAELTAELPRAPVDAALATDGVAEILHLSCADDAPTWATTVVDGPVGRITATDTATSWLVQLGRLTGTEPGSGEVLDEPTLARAVDLSPSFDVRAPAGDLDAWLWNRGSDAAVRRTGEHAAFDEFVQAGQQ